VRLARRRVDPGERALLDLAGAIQALEEARPRKPQVEVVEAPKEDKPPAPSTYQPLPGPQTLLEASNADEILFGGGAGPGKTVGCIGLLRERVKLRGYRAIVFRRRTTDLANAIDRAKEVYRDGRPNGRFAFAPFAPFPLARLVQRGKGGTMLFDAWGSRIEFGHCHRDNDYLAHMGQEYDDIIFDEGSHFTRAQYENLSGRLRGIVQGIRRRSIVTANPPGEDEPGFEWIRQKWALWIDPEAKLEPWEGLDEGGKTASGEYIPPQTVRLEGLPSCVDAQGKPIPPAASGQIVYVAKDKDGAERFSAKPFVWNGVPAQGRTFIRATLADNPAIGEEYLQKLRGLDPVDRERLEEGSWTVRRGRGSMFRRDWIRVIELHDVPKASNIVGDIRCWDKAATEPSTDNPDPNWTRGLRGALVYKASPLSNGEMLPANTILVRHLASCRFGPGERDHFIRTTAEQDGKEVRIRGPQDPAGAGVTDVVAFRTMLRGFAVKTELVSNNKVLRASPASSAAHPKSTGGRYGRIAVVRGEWNDAFFAELESFPKGKDDIVDTLSDLVDELDNHTTIPAKAPPPPAPYNFESQPLGI
jgi:phage terminase large subunit-like protein